jgi:hypothetical protein
MLKSSVESRSKTPLTSGWSENFAGSPVSAKIQRKLKSFAPKSVDCSESLFLSLMLMVAITGFPNACYTCMAESTPDILSFANGLSVTEKPATFSCSLSFFIFSIVGFIDAPCGGVISTVIKGSLL